MAPSTHWGPAISVMSHVASAPTLFPSSRCILGTPGLNALSSLVCALRASASPPVYQLPLPPLPVSTWCYQPFYDVVAAAVHAADPDRLVFFEPVRVRLDLEPGRRLHVHEAAIVFFFSLCHSIMLCLF